MSNVIVRTDLIAGTVDFHCNIDGEILRTKLRWLRASEDVQGFVVEEDTCSVIDWEVGSLLPICEVGAEIILNDYLKILMKLFSIEKVMFSYGDGIKLKDLVFMPPSISDDREVKAFPAMQKDLKELYLEYHKEGALTPEIIYDAKDDDLLEDFLSLINCENYLSMSLRKA